MKYIILLFMFCSVASAQISDTRTSRESNQISIYQIEDSVRLFTVPANCELRSLVIICDTVLSPGGTDSLKVGIQGEDTPYSNTFRFADIWNDSLQAGEVIHISHYNKRQSVRGMLYTYGGSIVVECADADTYYPIRGLVRSERNDMDTSVDMSALKIRKYCGGSYFANITMSFSGSKANILAHGELFIDEGEWDQVSFERSIGTASSTGDAGAVGGIALADYDSCRFMLESDAASTDYTVTHAQFVLQRQRDDTPYKTGSGSKNIMLYSGATTGRFRFYLEYVQY